MDGRVELSCLFCGRVDTRQMRPGIPLHYAGDEQDFDTPGSALDGWAREAGKTWCRSKCFLAGSSNIPLFGA